MKNYFYLLFFCLSGTNILHSQVISNKLLKGKIISNIQDVDNINIFNLNSKNSSLTENGGFFTIKVAIGDTLQFSSVQYKSLKKILKDSDFQNEIFYVRMESLTRQLDEVKIDEYKNVNAVSLGILSEPAKKYSPAERKLYAATSGGGIVPVDAVLNWISGRTKMLKKEVGVEKKEILLEKTTYLFDEKYFTETLKIPEEYVKGFQYYIIEDSRFVDAIKVKNKTMATFVLNELAVNYKKLLQENK